MLLLRHHGARALFNPWIVAARHSSSMAGDTFVKRLTMFKIPKEEDIEKVLKEYEVLRGNAKRASSACDSIDFGDRAD